MTTTSPQVLRVQELRRSNAAQPRPGQRQNGPTPDEWDDDTAPTPAGKGTREGWITRPGRELPKVWRDIAVRLVDEQGWTYRYKRKGGSHPRVIPPAGGLGVALPTTVTDGDAGHRASYLTALRRAGAVLDEPAPAARSPRTPSRSVVPSGDAPAVGAQMIDKPWTDTEWREMQRDSDIWWRQMLAGGPRPQPAPDAKPGSPWTPEWIALMERCADQGRPLAEDAAGNGRYTLAQARDQLRQGYSLAIVMRRTGYGRLWLQDLADRLGA